MIEPAEQWDAYCEMRERGRCQCGHEQRDHTIYTEARKCLCDGCPCREYRPTDSRSEPHP